MGHGDTECISIYDIFWLVNPNIHANSFYRNFTPFTIKNTRIGDELKYASFTTCLDTDLL